MLRLFFALFLIFASLDEAVWFAFRQHMSRSFASLLPVVKYRYEEEVYERGEHKLPSETLKLWQVLLRRRRTHHCFIPGSSPWPFVTSQALACLLLCTVAWMHYFENSYNHLKYSLYALVLMISFWMKDLIIEGQYMGVYTQKNIKSIRLGFALFIVSEVMFFFALFWSFFHFSINPSVWIGSVWPPYGMKTIPAFGLPFLNTIILVTSGLTLSYCQKSMIQNYAGDRENAIDGMLWTIFLAVFFLFVQRYEFIHAPFSINDSVYGSIFFFITGFHGLHVMGGTFFLFIVLIRMIDRHFYQEIALALDLASWYWHFVDVVWIFVFIIVYWWGGR